MPRRLRVAFAAQQFLTLQCASGTFTRFGRNATLSYVQNQVIADTWTRLDTGGYTYGNSRAGPDINQGWTQQAIDFSTGYVFGFQGYAQDTNRGNFFFNTSLGYWERTNAIQNDWHRNTGAISENYDITYDADRNCFWRSRGGPFGGNPNIPAGQNEAGPWLGDGKYNIATDEWSTPYPVIASAWVPLPGDTGYFGTPTTNFGMSDCCYEYYNDDLYAFGGWAPGGGTSTQRLHKRNVDTGAITELVSFANCPPWGTQPTGITNKRSGFNRTTKELYTLADNAELYTWSMISQPSTWTHVTTTGDRPDIAAPSVSPSYTGGDWGLICSVDEAANCLVAWCGQNGIASTTEASIRKTWILDLATRVWREGPSFGAGHTVPAAVLAASETLLYDPVNRRTILTTQADHYTQVWKFEVAPIGGIITSWALPASSGGTYGVNYYGFPYLTNGDSKHTNMAHCPLDNRLYVTGGDTQIGSAVDGTWSMSLDDGTWRLDVGQPSYPTLAAPHSYQEGALFKWMPVRQKLLFFGGIVFGYQADGSAIYNYSSGYWMYDPVAGTWEQVSLFFPNPTLSHYVDGTSNLYGGVYDETTDTVYVLSDPSNASAARRWNIGAGTVDSNVSFSVPSLSGFPGCYFTRTRQCQIGRYIYATGYYTNGIDGSPANNRPALFRWGIDDHTFTRLTAPPDFTATVKDIELCLFASNGKIVHPRRYGPDGAMPEGIHVYDPASDTWETDTKTPAYGAFIYNSGCELTDGRIAMSGGVFGDQQTHLWFYEAT